MGLIGTSVNTPREEEARFGDRLKGNVCNEGWAG